MPEGITIFRTGWKSVDELLGLLLVLDVDSNQVLAGSKFKLCSLSWVEDIELYNVRC